MKNKSLLKFYKTTSQFNKNLLICLLTMFIAVAIYSHTAVAAKILFSPESSKSTVGKTVTLNIDIDPGNDRLYTVRADIRFPSNMLSVDTWNFNKDWWALRQLDSDSLDNNAGTLVRSAGFTGGVIERKRFGTLTFKTKAEGTATITVNGKSYILDADGANKLSNNGSATIVIGKGEATKIIKPEKSNNDKMVDLVYSSNVVKDKLYANETVIVLTKLKNDNAKLVNAKVITTLYNNNGQALNSKEDSVGVDTQSDIAQQLPTDNIALGAYSIINEVTYDGQTAPQKSTINFNIISERVKEVSHAITDEEMIKYVWTNTMTWILLMAIIAICLSVGYITAKSLTKKNKKREYNLDKSDKSAIIKIN